MPEELKIRGSVVKGPRDWLRTAYTPAAFQAALLKLPREDQAWVNGDIYAAAWYPIAVWDRFLEGMRAEAFIWSQESVEQFNRRFMEETGSAIVRGVYRFVLGLMSPVSVIQKVSVIFDRAYSEGRTQIVENVPGRAVVQFVGASPGLRTNLSNHFLTGILFVLRLHGAKGIEGRISRDEVVDGKLVFEVTVTYEG